MNARNDDTIDVTPTQTTMFNIYHLFNIANNTTTQQRGGGLNE